MNVASLELCKGLYELSGWEQTKFVFNTTTITHDIELRLRTNRDNTPAYDLGYLLRKLPMTLKPNSASTLTVFGTAYGKWKACYAMNPFYLGEADTPEDAIARLAVELFKHGILTKEASTPKVEKG